MENPLPAGNLGLAGSRHRPVVEDDQKPKSVDQKLNSTAPVKKGLLNSRFARPGDAEKYGLKKA